MALTKARLLKHDFPVHGKIVLLSNIFVSEGISLLVLNFG